MAKDEKIKNFNPNDLAGAASNLFGLPFNEEESDIVILPVPWEVTVSYRAGTAGAPRAILEASHQVDLYDPDVPDAWKSGIFMKKVDKWILNENKELRAKARKYLSSLEEGENMDSKPMRKIRGQVNKGGDKLKKWVRREMQELLHKGKLPGLLGGDHSTPLGFMEALAEVYPKYGILQIDAHCDLRNAYEGLEYSHASIMFNALKIPQVTKLVQAGIRDFCQEEIDLIRNSHGRVKAFFDADMKRDMYEGESWKEICDHIVHHLPDHVYISFDIDGLDPKLCPNTGTPVAGGLQFEQAVYLILKVVRSGKKIIGFDLNEVAPGRDEWDANVGARMLFKLSNFLGLSSRLFNESVVKADTESPTNDEEVLEVYEKKIAIDETREDKGEGD